MPTAATGRILAGRYRLISELGVGGMGVTYRAWDDVNAVPVVVKMPKREAQSDEEALRRFAREIDAMLALPHEHIVPITDHGDDDGCPYVVMRFLPGGSLADHRRRDDEGNPLANPAGMLHFWLPVIAEALDYIHQRGMLHRDVKPGNIFFDGFWNAFLGDFGIAKVIDSSGGIAKEQTITATMVAIGTPEYMAPELFSPKAKPDGRTDQYALAVTVYEMLCGVRPFTGSRAHIVVEHSSMQVPPLQNKGLKLPQSLCDAVEQALAKTPEARFGTCSDFVRAALRDVAPLIPDQDITRLLCPGCNNILKLPQRAAGRTGKCPKCREPIDVAEDLGSLWLKSEERGAGTTTDKQSLMPLDEPLTKASKGDMWRWGMLALATCCGLALGYISGAATQRAKIQTELKQAESQWRQAADESLAKATSDIAELKRTLAKRDNELSAVSANASVPSDALRWGGHAYYFVPDVVTQQDAVTKCRNMGGYLARIETEDENQLVMAAFQELAQVDVGNTDLRFWIDGSDRSKEGEWRRSDGSLMKFLGWRQGEPNSEGEDEDGLQIMTGGWNDISMARQCGFICEWDGIQSSGETTIEAAVASVLSSWEQRFNLQTANRAPKSDELPTDSVEKQLPLTPAFSRDELVVGDTLTNSLGIKLVLIPAGRFEIGRDPPEGNSDTKKVEVEFSQPFFIGATEVTQGQWIALMGSTPWMSQVPGRAKQGPRFAASCISWENATAFCAKLTALERTRRRLGTHESYRLPTEAEWEYACRAGTTTYYCFGDEHPKLDEYAWWGNNNGYENGVALPGVGTAKGEPYAHEVGLKKPNPWGLYDIYGNVWEWCGDWYAKEYSGGLDPAGPSSGDQRTQRGGSWSSEIKACRTHGRRATPPSHDSVGYGFRVVLSKQAH